MEQHFPQDPPAPETASAAPQPIRAQWTPAKQRIFLVALIETGSVARSARAAGMSRSSAHRLRQRLAGTPFDRGWDDALAIHARRMADPFAAATPTPAPTAPRPHRRPDYRAAPYAPPAAPPPRD